ncbi:membrane protein [Paenibacillus terrae HPL-003]|uniref:Membrane protein n=1 Tax=Paenibacillus terrae (strain HPL-003) TaxID=985665 RepID=G7W195_PAETH|nr:membrane protein [Paenibacillus terrae HPL-003]
MGFIALAVWVLTTFVIEILQIKSKKIRDFTDGKTTTLIKDGKILEDNMRKERLTIDELMEQLRSKNVFKVSDVEFAIMETSGEINVLLAKDKQPVTLKDLNMLQLPEKEPTAIIMDGLVMEQQMAYMGITQQWLDAKLKEKSLTVKDVFFAQGELYIDQYSDNVQMSKVQDSNQAVLTLLEQCTTELQKLALNSSEQQRKQLYELCSHNLKEAIQEMQPVNSSNS